MNSKIIWHSLPGIIWVSVIHTYTFSTFPWPTLPPTCPLSQREYSVSFHTVYTCIMWNSIELSVSLRPFMSLCFVLFVLVLHKPHEERKGRLMGDISSVPFIINPSCFVIYRSYRQACVRPCKLFFDIFTISYKLHEWIQNIVAVPLKRHLSFVRALIHNSVVMPETSIFLIHLILSNLQRENRLMHVTQMPWPHNVQTHLPTQFIYYFLLCPSNSNMHKHPSVFFFWMRCWTMASSLEAGKLVWNGIWLVNLFEYKSLHTK